MEINNSIFIKVDEQESRQYDYTPDMRGASISYTVNLSSMDCGCVAGAYFVQTNDSTCTQDPLDSTLP